MKIKIPVLKCLRCGHEWHPRRDETPAVCPKCKNARWDRPRRIVA